MEQLETPRYFKGVSNFNEVAKVTVENDSIYLERTWRDRPVLSIGAKTNSYETNIGIKFKVTAYSTTEFVNYLRELNWRHGWIECTYEEFLRGLLQ